MALQFSTEFTNIVPAGLRFGGKALNFARKLQCAGSDIVVEEDLAAVLGLAKIEHKLASSFRTLVIGYAGGGPMHAIAAGIVLTTQMGPTVLRAVGAGLDSPYYSMVVQCSLLVASHEPRALTYALSRVFEEAHETATNNINQDSDYIPRTPSESGIYGFLMAVQDQTVSAYDWRAQLFAVGHTLGFPDRNIHEAIPPTVLTALVKLLPVVQKFPEVNQLLIDITHGVCPIVVWAHRVLGLSVLVRVVGPESVTEHRFGKEREQVEVHVRLDVREDDEAIHFTPMIYQHTVTLLSSRGDPDFVIKADLDGDIIDGTHRGPARGIAKRVVESDHSDIVLHAHDTMLHVALITTAFARLWSHHLQIEVKSDFEPYGEGGVGPSPASKEFEKLPFNVDFRKLIDAAQFVFDDRRLDTKQVQEYVNDFLGKPVDEIRVTGGPLRLALDSMSGNEDRRMSRWDRLRRSLLHFSVLVFAFSQALDISGCSELPMREGEGILRTANLASQLSHWDGSSKIALFPECAYGLVATMLAGELETMGALSALTSRCGWSIFLSTFGDSDAISKEKGAFAIQRGVPYRNHVWRRDIIDFGPVFANQQKWQEAARPGTEIDLGRSSRLRFEPDKCGLQADCFVIKKMLVERDLNRQTLVETGRATGYFDLFTSLWTTVRTEPCNHSYGRNNPVRLPADCVALSAFGDEGNVNDGVGTVDLRIGITLTARNPAARWRALIAIQKSRDSLGPRQYMPVLLRGEDCCFDCAVKQAEEKKGNWLLVL